MSDQEQQPVVDEFHRQLEMLLKHGSSTADRILSYAKLRIAANEHLILLASGTLTLTVSGAITLASRGNLHADWIMLRPLLDAWKLLIFTIVCCIIANSREQNAANFHDSDLLAAELWSRLTVLDQVAKKIKPDIAMKIPDKRAVGKGTIQELIALVLGWMARVSTVLSFILLYQFAKSILIRL